MTKRKQTRSDSNRVHRLLRRAEAVYREIAVVLCTPAVRRATRRSQQASALVSEAIRIAAGPAMKRLGISDEQAALYPFTFVDDASYVFMRDTCHGLLRARRGFGEDIRIPRRSDLEYELVRQPRATARRLMRIARLDPGSAELRALVRTVGRSGIGKRKKRPRRVLPWRVGKR